MLNKIKNLHKHPYMSQLNDLHSWGMIVFGVIAIMVTWSGIKSVQANYGLQRQISRLQQENQVQDLQNKNLKLQNEYLNTDQYLELAARQDLGKAAPGEQILLVPKKVALAHTVNISTGNSKAASRTSINEPTYQKNFQAWIDFFLHRPSTQ